MRVRGFLLLMLIVLVLLAAGFGIVELVALPFGGVSTGLAILLGVGVVLYVLWVARHVLSWLLISLFLALALNPLVGWLQRHGLKRRGAAAGVTFLLAIAVVTGFGGSSTSRCASS